MTTAGPNDPSHADVGKRCVVGFGFSDGVVRAVQSTRGLHLVLHDDGLVALWKTTHVRILD